MWKRMKKSGSYGSVSFASVGQKALLNVQRRFGNQYETTDRWCRCVANPFRRRLSGNRAKAGLLTCPNSPRLPVRLSNSGQWGECRLWVRRDSQQRELLPIYTAFPFNPLINLFFGGTVAWQKCTFFQTKPNEFKLWGRSQSGKQDSQFQNSVWEDLSSVPCCMLFVRDCFLSDATRNLNPVHMNSLIITVAGGVFRNRTICLQYPAPCITY